MKTAYLHQYHFSFSDLLTKIFHHRDNTRLGVKKIDASETCVNVDYQKSFLPSQKKGSSNNIGSSEFFAAIVHELKTPLNAIMGLSELLKDDLKNPKSLEECIDYAKEISAVANEMNELIHDILDVESAAFSGNFSVDLSKEVDLNNVIKRSVKLNHDYSIKRRVAIKTEISDEIKSIKLDAKRLKQILTNLISNAVKYSPENGEVKITAKNSTKDNQEFLEICVIDRGFGMTKEQVAIAFQKYQTIQNPSSGKVDSFGLGLPIAKQLVELQNGSLEVSSQLGQGTKMKIKFPYLM